ncbi:MAG TPA: aspartate aminotransferase family protein [Candidatus Acidoferrales bacterium]|nr:aspartate aminotransferase family protein [Candidatus Acidoferrales bacterium]
MSDLERLVTPIPGPASRAAAARLRAAESRGITFLGDDYPVFWQSASGATVIDVDGNQYLDLTSAFGVAAVGHSNPLIARAIAEQACTLMHGMGDVHPTDVRTQLVERLAASAPIDDGRVFLCSTGAEAVECALKTAALATGEPNVLAFGGAYHGLSYGALEVCGIPKFRKPWQRQLRESTSFVPFPDMRDRHSLEMALQRVERGLRRQRAVGALICEPIQGRAGIIIPPDGFLAGLRALCTRYDTVLIVDEIYTGLGRTGSWFVCEREGVRPDIICVGKALGGGFPISAAIGCSSVMDAWQPSTGEALHTSTFLGNPMGCAAALAALDEFDRLDLCRAAQRIGERLAVALQQIALLPAVRGARGRGALWALEMRDGDLARSVVVQALARGLMLVQAGLRGEVVAIAPPLIIEHDQLERALTILEDVVRAQAAAL